MAGTRVTHSASTQATMPTTSDMLISMASSSSPTLPIGITPTMVRVQLKAHSLPQAAT